MVMAQSNVIFDEDKNAHISCLRPITRNNSNETEQPAEITEVITEINLFDLPPEEIHIEDIDLSETDESMDHGHIRSRSGTEECMTHGRTKAACPIDDGNPAARANPDLALPGHTNGHEDRRLPDPGQIDGHHIYI
jgi:hypothetical protein